MITKNISYKSSAVLQFFIANRRSWFNASEIKKALPSSSENAIWELLSDMTKRGLLLRIKNGTYFIIPFDQDPKSFMPEWHTVAESLCGDNAHYIAYSSALQLHNLSTQPALNEIIVVDRQIKPSLIKVKNVKYQFVFHNSKHFFGGTQVWIDSFQKVWCSDMEKTLVDCLFKPGYGAGIVEIANALYKSAKSLNYDKLLKYVIAFDSQAVIKRLGFLLELLKIENPIVEQLQNIKTDTYILLDTEMPRAGKRLTRWGIQQNIDSETIQSAILT